MVGELESIIYASLCLSKLFLLGLYDQKLLVGSRDKN